MFVIETASLKEAIDAVSQPNGVNGAGSANGVAPISPVSPSAGNSGAATSSGREKIAEVELCFPHLLILLWVYTT